MSDSTEIEPITTERLIAVMADVVEEYGPDHVYTTDPTASCYYVPRPEFDDNRARSGCLIGEILARTGHLDAHRAILGRSQPMGITVAAVHLPDLFDRRETATVASVAQVVQDDGKTWGEALELARRTVTYIEIHGPRYRYPTPSEIENFIPPAA